MKLRNKKTGEIVNALEVDLYTGVIYLKISKDGRHDVIEYDSLAELNEEWEDYDDTKDCWGISYIGSTQQYRQYVTGENVELCKQIGNYFETKEEAEKAVEKLKAWKRLKDKGFVWQGWEEGAMDNGMCVISCQIPENNWETDVGEDLDLLFGGEE